MGSFCGKTAKEIIENAKRLFREDYKRKNGEEFKEGRTYPSSTWFMYIEKRRPLLLVYLIDIDFDEEEPTQQLQVNNFKDKMSGIPVVGLALGLPQNPNAAKRATKYKANKVYNWFEQDEILAESEEEE